MKQYNTYQPRRPIKSFQDLEVYQKLLSVSVAIAKRLNPPRHCEERSNPYDIQEKIIELALSLPRKIATAHSLRFSDHEQALRVLEETMLGCNLLVVYLEQYRDIDSKDIEIEFYEEHIKTLLTMRFRIMHLQMSWKRFGGKKDA